jgi:extracellular factor (EF) 3-hydroxypalmitic acid methyl ester biosynthesis protein
MEDTRLKETVLLGLSSQGLEIRAMPLRLSRYLVVFEVYREGTALRTSEVLTDFRILVRERMIYFGRAVIKNLVDTGLLWVCEAALEEAWVETELVSLNTEVVAEEFGSFFREWQKLYRVTAEFKLMTADVQTFLTDFRLWVEQAEVGIRALPSGDRIARERETAELIARASFPTIDALFDKLETVSAAVEPELRPAHEVYVRRQLHPLVLCAPFAFRSVQKPLGYAGDYETVNMILRDAHEGGSLFAKVLNRWFVKQPPAEAHRNRISYLIDHLACETVRLRGGEVPCRVFNLGCGPAWEVQRFLEASDLSNQARFTLLDFNEETLQHARSALEEIKQKHRRSTTFEFVKKSVVQLLRARSRAVEEPRYDFVYCAGLFDYLPDTVCRQLLGVVYDWVAPGGLVIATNVDPSNPIRNWLAFLLDWHLIYRDARRLAALAPPGVPPEQVRVVADATGVNVFLEIRRPPAP